MYRYYINRITSLISNEKGQGMVEYALIIVGVAVALIVAIGILKGDINAVFTKIGETLNPSS